MDKRDYIRVPNERRTIPRSVDSELKRGSCRGLIAILLAIIAVLSVCFFAMKPHP